MVRAAKTLSLYAPWATDAIRDNALCQAVCCKLRGDGSMELLEGTAQNTNHWVASFPVGSASLPSGDDSHSLGEGESEVTETFYATYLSLSQHIVKTIGD